MTKEYQLHFDEEKISSSSLDLVVECLFLALLVFMPFAFGVVHAWSEEVVIATAGVMLFLFMVKFLVLKRQEFIWTWAYVPIALFLLVIVVQLIPLPTWLLKIVSPNTVTLRAELLGNLPDSETLLQFMPVSLYPNGTKHDLRLVLTVTAVFVIVLNVFRRSDQIKRLLMTIAFVGGLVAVITLAQNLFGNGRIYWSILSTNTKGYSGPFVNHNNYGQFINLSIGAAFALFMVKLEETFSGKKVTPTVVFERLSWRSSTLIWLLLVMMSIASATVFISLTRGGMVSLIFAMVLTTALFASQQSLKGHGWIMMAVGLLSFICVLYVGFDAIYARLASLRDFGNAADGRLQILKDIAVVWTVFPIIGTGLGTHSVVYPMFDRSTISALAAYAENEYAQILEETGLIGLGLLVILGFIIFRAYLRIIRHNDRPIHFAAYGLGFGLVAILIHSLSDFGQHLPANAILSATFCSLLLVLARFKQNIDGKRIQMHVPYVSSKVFRTIIFTCVCLLWGWMLLDADKARLSAANWQKAFEIEKNLSVRNWDGTESEYSDLISYATKAVAYEPDNITYRHLLCTYHWRSLCRAKGTILTDKINRDKLIPMIQDILNELRTSSIICPTHGPTYSMAGQIEKFVLNDNGGADKIRKGYRLAPCNPITCFVAGWFDMLEGRIDDCVIKFERAVQLESSLFYDIADIYINQLSRPYLAVSAAGNNIEQLGYVIEKLEDMQYYDLVEEIREKVRLLLVAKCNNSSTSGSMYAHLASIYQVQGNNQAALECYRQALAREYGQINWRLESAKILLDMGRALEAISEAKICLQLHPQHETAEKFVADLSIHPAIVAQKNRSP